MNIEVGLNVGKKINVKEELNTKEGTVTAKFCDRGNQRTS